jgi:predicted glycosyltransferase
MDIVSANTRAVLVPFSGAGETEQAMRAARLAQHHLVALVPERSISPPALAAAVDNADAMVAPDFAWIDRRGVEASVRIVRETLGAVRLRPEASA